MFVTVTFVAVSGNPSGGTRMYDPKLDQQMRSKINRSKVR